MRRFGLLILVLAAAAGFATPSYAYSTPGKTTGSEIKLTSVGPSLWDVTIESDGDTSSGAQFAVGNGVTLAFAALCDGVTNFCFEVPGDGAGVGILGTLYIGVATVAAAPGPFGLGAGNPVTLGTLSTSGGPYPYVNGSDIVEVFGVDGSLLPGTTDVVGGMLPEPTSLGLLGAGVVGMAFLRRARSAG